MQNTEYFLHSLFSSEKKLNVIQIGACDGIQNDPLYRYLRNNKGNILMKPIIARVIELKTIHPFLKKYSEIIARQTNMISICPLDIVASKGKLIPTINKAEGLISRNLFFMVK